eukprot:GFUD01075494.1.p1 GENE.GFUD01075494.1~~GFUD01075494.1.p1  ORF type:complete len:129 (+),score=29.73 GFUD01075494.1:410-796(+)
MVLGRYMRCRQVVLICCSPAYNSGSPSGQLISRGQTDWLDQGTKCDRSLQFQQNQIIESDPMTILPIVRVHDNIGHFHNLGISNCKVSPPPDFVCVLLPSLDEFNEVDTNRDGFIHPAEFDSSLDNYI